MNMMNNTDYETISKPNKQAENNEINKVKLSNNQIWIRICFVSTVIIAVFIAEMFFREPLYKANVSIAIDIQAKSSDKTKTFIMYASELGSSTIITVIGVIIYLLIPLNEAFTMIFSFISASYLTSLLKMLYANPRPYWTEPNIQAIKCSGGYGNPSGHAFMTTVIMLNIWYFSKKRKPIADRIWLSTIIFVICMSIVGFICYTRIFLGAHSINQVIFGTLLGLIVFFITFYILRFQELDYKDFIQLFTDKLNIILSLTAYVSLILVIIFVYLFYKTDNSMYLNEINRKCPDDPPIKQFSNSGLMEGLTIFSLIGSHLGMIFSFNFTPQDKHHEIINFKGFKCPSYLYFILILICTGGIWFALLAISSKSILVVQFIFKAIIPLLFFTFAAFGLVPYLMVRWEINKP